MGLRGIGAGTNVVGGLKSSHCGVGERQGRLDPAHSSTTGIPTLNDSNSQGTLRELLVPVCGLPLSERMIVGVTKAVSAPGYMHEGG